MITLRLSPALLLLGTALVATPAFAQETHTPGSAVTTNLAVLARADASLKDKVDACRELARCAGAEAVEPLGALLADPKLSHAARYGLETIPGPEVDARFRRALGELHGRLLVGVIGSVGVRRDGQAVGLLGKLLADPDPEVAQAAARSLGRIGSIAAIKPIEAALTATSATNRPAFCEGLLRGAERLSADGQAAEAQAVYDLLRAVVSAEPLPPQIQTAAWRGAILTRGKAGVPLLREALAATDYHLFAAGVRIADELAGSEATKALTDALAATAGDRALVLLEALGRRGDITALAAVSAVGQTGAKPLRLAALHTLSQWGSATTVPLFEFLLADPDAEVAKGAGESLAALAAPEASIAILKLIAEPTAAKKLLGMELATRRRLGTALPALAGTARDNDPALRAAAVRSLGSLAGPADLPLLLELLGRAPNQGEIDSVEQALTATCLRAPVPMACAEALRGGLAAAKPAQQCALLHTLAAVGGPTALASVRAAVDSAEPTVHAAALRALAGWGSREAAPDLLKLARASTQPAERLICLRGYLGFARQGETPEAERLALCREAAGLGLQPEEKRLLLGALGDLASPEAIPLAAACLEDPAVRREAASAVLEIATKVLAGPNGTAAAPSLTQVLGKVAALDAGPEIAARAGKLLEQARAKSGGK